MRVALAPMLALATFGGCSLLVDTGGLLGARGTAAIPGAPTHRPTRTPRCLDASPDADALLLDARASAYKSAILADGPLAYWRMGITTGTVIPDETGRGNVLTLQGHPLLGQSGAIANDDDPAIHFDGASAYATAKDARPFDFANRHPFTLELWASFDANVSTEDYPHLIDSDEDLGGPPSATATSSTSRAWQRRPASTSNGTSRGRSSCRRRLPDSPARGSTTSAPSTARSSSCT
jgi:hypothetical protein